MSIDWITVSAQIVNFLILVWLLKHFLYQPVVSAMERREQRIADRLNDAQTREQKANQAQQDYEAKLHELEQKQAGILDAAKEDAEQQKRKMLNEAREEVAETRRSWQRQAEQEKAEFLGNLRYQANAAIQAVTRKALGDLADTHLEEHIINVFIERLKALDKSARKVLAGAGEPLRLASTFELDSALRSRLTRAIHEHIADGIEVNYTESPELLCGIELASGGHRLGWNLAEFMSILDKRIEEAFESTSESGKET